MCWCADHSYPPGFVTRRHVILTLPRLSAHWDTTTLTTFKCWHWGPKAAFHFHSGAALKHWDSSFLWWIRSLGIMKGKNQAFDGTSACICKHTLFLLVLFCSDFLRRINVKVEMHIGSKQTGSALGVLKVTLLGGWREPQICYLLSKQTCASLLICLQVTCLPFKNISSITSWPTASWVLQLYYVEKTKAFQLCVFCL